MPLSSVSTCNAICSLQLLCTKSSYAIFGIEDFPSGVFFSLYECACRLGAGMSMHVVKRSLSDGEPSTSYTR